NACFVRPIREAYTVVVPELMHLRVIDFWGAVVLMLLGVVARLIPIGRPGGIVANIEIEFAVVIIVTECGAGRIAGAMQRVHPHLMRHIGKSPTPMLIMKQSVLAICGDKEVVVTVVIIIADCHAMRVAQIRIKARTYGYIAERAITVVV